MLSLISVSSSPVYCLHHCYSIEYHPISLVLSTFHIPLYGSSYVVIKVSSSIKMAFTQISIQPPTNPLYPIHMSNTRSRCLTATAGTNISRNYSYILSLSQAFAYRTMRFTTIAFIPLYVSLVQTFVHWPIFSTAAFYWSLDRLSYPMERYLLSKPLWIFGLVGFYSHQLPNPNTTALLVILSSWIFFPIPVFIHPQREDTLSYYSIPVRQGSSHFEINPTTCNVLYTPLVFTPSQDQTHNSWFIYMKSRECGMKEFLLSFLTLLFFSS